MLGIWQMPKRCCSGLPPNGLSSQPLGCKGRYGPSSCMHGMSDNLVVKVHHRLGSRNYYLRARVSIVRWNPKEAGGKVPAR
jgi:hypothetical protein